jgi:hypothetical protein
MMTAATAPAAAQDAPARDPLPADFKGRVTYQGSWEGELISPGRPPRRLDLSSLINSAMSGKRERRGGAVTYEVEYDGTIVRATYSGTGGMMRGEMTGTRSGTTCSFVNSLDGGRGTAYCDRNRFEAVFKSPRHAQQRYSTESQATVTRFVDYAAQERERLAALERQRQATPTPSPASTTRGRPAAAGAPLVITTAALGIALDELLDRVVYADSQSWGFNKYIRGSMRNGRYITTNKSKTTYTAYGEYDFTGLGGSGWVKVKVRDGQIECLEYHDQAGNCRPLYHSLSQQAIAGVATGMAEDALRGDPPSQSRGTCADKVRTGDTTQIIPVPC